MAEGPFIRMEYIEGYDLIGLQKKYGALSSENSVKVIRPILNEYVGTFPAPWGARKL